MIIFVGDKPSKHNVDPTVPFVGTKSYKTLLGWIADMDIDIRDVDLDNANTFDTSDYKTLDHRWIALGLVASTKLSACGIPHFALPHPSGLNRALNDKKRLKAQLQECKEWLNEI